MTQFGHRRLLGLVLAAVSGGLLTIVVLAGDWSGNRPETSDAASKIPVPEGGRILPVLVTRLGELASPARTDDYRGVLQPSKSAELAFRRSGRVEKILVEEGSVVTDGQTLGRLECGDIEALLEGTEARIREAQATLAELEAGPRKETIASAEADVRRLEAIFELSKVTASRERQLQQTNASSAQAYDNARYSTQQQLAALEAAKQQLNELQAGTRAEQIDAQKARVAALEAERKGYLVDLADSRIVAPFSGVIARRYIDEGSIAGPQTPILRLLQIDPLEAKFGLTPNDAASISVGQKLSVAMGQLNIDAYVSNIEPEVDLATRTQGVILSIPRSAKRPDVGDEGHDSGLSEGSLATGNVIAGRTVSLSLNKYLQSTDDQFWVPLTALSKSTRGLWSLMVVTPYGDGVHQVTRRDVQVQEADTNMARITGGMITKGDLVVADGTHRITPGMLVEPIISNAARFEIQP